MNRTKATAHGLKRVFAAAAAAGVALSVGFGSVPAFAVGVPPVGPPEVSSPAVSEAGLNEAVLRDLGLTPEEFAAAGQLGKRATDAAASLGSLPGYTGIRLENGKIVVEGSGDALQARVDELNQAGPADFMLVALEAPPAAPTASAVPQDASTSPARADLAAGDVDQLFQAYVREVGPADLKAVVFTDGHFVIRTGAPSTPESGVPVVLTPALPPTPGATAAAPGKLSPAEFAARYSNVQLETGASLKTEEELFGGQGYFADNLATCSAGFSAFGPTGLPLVLTAGHCTEDGVAQAAGVEPPTSAPAGGSTTPRPTPPYASLGSFGFSQFGGPNNSKATADGSSVGTDIAVIQDIRPDLSLQPGAMKWDNLIGPASTAAKIIGTAAPVQGQPVCRSGRTSGWKCGTVDSVGIWMMPGRNSLPPFYDNDLRAVRAFDSTSVKSSGGDSGGPWVSGNFAVGTHVGAETSSDGRQLRAIAAILEDSITKIPGGVQLELFLNRPVVTSPAAGATFDAGQTVTGMVAAAPASAVAAGSRVRITVNGQAPFEVPVNGSGAWSFVAPATSGALRFTAETVNGFSTSGAAAFDFSPATAEAGLAQDPPPTDVPTAIGQLTPAGDSAAVVRPAGDNRAASLANTGASGLILAGGLAAGALAVGGVLLALARRRKRQRPTPT